MLSLSINDINLIPENSFKGSIGFYIKIPVNLIPQEYKKIQNINSFNKNITFSEQTTFLLYKLADKMKKEIILNA